MTAELIAITPDAEAVIERAGRICYASAVNPATRSEFIRARIRDGHESILEHASATFEICGISRACSHQLVRHRLASFSQQSQRYVKENDFDYVVPPSLRNNTEYAAAMETIRTIYACLIEDGAKPEDARFILPNATETRLMMTANFREWRHILKLRLDKKAQWEVRAVAGRILSDLAGKSPAVFGDFADV